MPSRLRNLTSKVKAKMNVLSREFENHRIMVNTLETNVVDEDKLNQWSTSLTTQHYETLTSRKAARESVMPSWLDLPVVPPDPYGAGKIQDSRGTDNDVKQSCSFFYKNFTTEFITCFLIVKDAENYNRRKIGHRLSKFGIDDVDKILSFLKLKRRWLRRSFYIIDIALCNILLSPR